jgi:hypothetical protein
MKNLMETTLCSTEQDIKYATLLIQIHMLCNIFSMVYFTCHLKQ